MHNRTVPHGQRRFSRRALLGTAAAAGVAATTGCSVTLGTPPIAGAGQQGKDAARKPDGSARNEVIEMYSLWGGTTGQGIVATAKEFEATHPDIGVKITFAPATGTTQQKLLTAVAGHNPPDVAQIIPLQTPQWAAMGIMTDLTDWFKRDGLKLDDFIAPAAECMQWSDRIWQLNWDADPNFPLFWNKEMFSAIGADPDKQPETIEQVDEYCAKMLKVENGRVTQIGMTPWDHYGFANSLYTWGFAFGGRFRVPGTDDVTPDDENVVRALEWICNSAKKVGGPDAVAVAPPSLAVHPFSTGKIGMTPLVAPNLTDVVETAPQLKLGAGLLPYAPPASKLGQGAWIGGWSAFIPANAKHPEAAWEFIKWWAASQEGTSSSWKHIGFPCSWKPAKALDEMKADPVKAPFHQTLFSTTNARPPTVVADFFNIRLEEMVGKAAYGQISPLEAMRQVKEATMTELKRFNREVRAIG